MNRDEKAKLVEDLHDRFAKAQVVVLTDYKGLDVQSINMLRRKLREANVEYCVVKNTLIRRAADGTDAALIGDFCKGPTALALSFDDPVAPAKVLCEFAKTNDKLEIRVGVMNGKIVDLDGIKALSLLPSREVLLAQVLRTMNGVPTNLVRALNDVPVKLLNVLQAIKDQKEAA